MLVGLRAASGFTVSILRIDEDSDVEPHTSLQLHLPCNFRPYSGSPQQTQSSGANPHSQDTKSTGCQASSTRICAVN